MVIFCFLWKTFFPPIRFIKYGLPVLYVLTTETVSLWWLIIYYRRIKGKLLLLFHLSRKRCLFWDSEQNMYLLWSNISILSRVPVWMFPAWNVIVLSIQLSLSIQGDLFQDHPQILKSRDAQVPYIKRCICIKLYSSSHIL